MIIRSSPLAIKSTIGKAINKHSPGSSFQNSDSHAILLWICNKLPATLTPLLRLYLLPELRHASRPARGSRAKPGMMVLDDIMEDDEPAAPDKACIPFIVCLHASISMVPIDKQNINLLIGKHTGYMGDRSRIVRRSIDNDTIKVFSCELC